MVENKKKIKFYDMLFGIMILSFILIILSIFILPEEQLRMDLIFYPWLIILFAGILCEIILTIGMGYHAFKMERYGWMVVVIFLGIIFLLIFYFAIMRKEFKKGKIKSKEKKNENRVY